MGEGVLPYAPTFRAHTQVRPYGNWATTGGCGPTSDRRQRLLRCARNDSCDLRAPLHLRIEKVLVFQLDAADRTGDRLTGRGREDFFLLQDPLADVVEVASGMLLVQGIQDVGQHHSRSLQTCSPFF